MTKNDLSFLMIVGAFLSSCGTYRAPENIQDKMKRFQSSHTNPNPVPPIQLKKISSHQQRSKNKKSPHFAQKKMKLNTKQVYFKTLYQQYDHLQAYLNQEDQKKLLHCPSFHNTFLRESSTLNHRGKKTISHNKEAAQKKSAPVNSLKDFLGSQNSYAALQSYSQNTYAELKEFCDTGTSANFYNFSNLITHINKDPKTFKQNQAQSLKSLLKTTVYANIAILKNLKKIEQTGRFPASTSSKLKNSEEDLHDFVQTRWSEGYFN